MSTGSYIQRSFAGGEISPQVAARADMVKYATGLRKCRNMIVEKHGGVRFRPGTSFINETKFSNRKCRLIEFIFSDDVSYVLELGHEYIRIFRNAVAVGGWENIKEVVTPYQEEDLPIIQYAQSADVITMTHQDYPIQQLRRFLDEQDEIDFELVEFETVPGILPPDNVTVDAPPQDPDDPEPPPPTSYSYVVTSISADTGEESLQSEAGSDGGAPLDDDNAVFIEWDVVDGADEYNVYKRSATDAYYYIGTRQVPDGFSSSRIQFSDSVRRIRNDDVTPPRRREPFDEAGKYPATVNYYQQRQWFASSENNPQQVHASKTAAFSNFGVSRPIQDDDAIVFTIAGRNFNEVRHLINIGKLVAMTSSGEWLVAGDPGGGVTPTQINLQQQGYSGASRLRPIVIESTAIYLQARGNVVRDLQYQFESDGYVGQDLTIFATHFFDGHSIVDWDFQQVPNSVVWAVRDDGVLLGLTYLPEHQIWGWHRHETDGKVESLTVVPEGNQDAVYIVVNRTINGSTRRYIERLEEQRCTCAEDAWHVDSGLRYDGMNESSQTISMSAASWGALDSVTLTSSDTDYFTTAGVRDDVGNEIVFYRYGDESIGEDPSAIKERLRVRITEVVNGGQATGYLQRDAGDYFESVGATTEWSMAVDSIAGLGHLEGKVIAIVGDGNVVYNGDPNGDRSETYRVENGAVTLDRPYTVITAGLKYRGEIETLDLEFPESETLSDKKKLINSVSMIVESTRGVKAGDAQLGNDGLKEYKQRSNEPLGDPTELKRGLVEIYIGGDWSKRGSILAVQDYPLPLTILAIIPTGRVGGK